MHVTKSQAASILGISSAEVLRRLEDGRLKGRKKTNSPFSDWVITIPDDAVGTPAGNAKIEEAVTAALEQSPAIVLPEIPDEPPAEITTSIPKEPEEEEKMPETEKEPTEEEIEEIEEEEHAEEKPKPAGSKPIGGVKEFLDQPWFW